jgi:acyl dehydratase
MNAPGRRATYGETVEPLVVEAVAGLRELIGKPIGPGSWRTVTQDLIDQFAAVSGDDEWIHVDPARAEREGPYAGTIAHGDLTLSLINGMRGELIEHRGLKYALNYGWDRVRYPSPLPVGSRVRVRAELLSVESVDAEWCHVVTRLVVEREGSDKPVCVADSAGRLCFGQVTDGLPA